MKIQISARVIEGGYTIAEASVQADDLLEAVARAARVFAPHLEAERQIQIVSCNGWCDECASYHFDVSKIIESFEAVYHNARRRGAEALQQMFKGLEDELAEYQRTVQTHLAAKKSEAN